MKKMSENLDKLGIPLLEMARLGTFDGYDFRIYTEPLGNPSFHLSNSDFEIVITIKELRILEVKRVDKSHFTFKKGDLISGALLKIINVFMSQKMPLISGTRKQYLVQVWNDNNPDYQIDHNYITWS